MGEKPQHVFQRVSSFKTCLTLSRRENGCGAKGMAAEQCRQIFIRPGLSIDGPTKVLKSKHLRRSVYEVTVHASAGASIIAEQERQPDRQTDKQREGVLGF